MGGAQRLAEDRPLASAASIVLHTRLLDRYQAVVMRQPGGRNPSRRLPNGLLLVNEALDEPVSGVEHD